MINNASAFNLNGLLYLHSKDVNRVQRLIDPLIIVFTFSLIEKVGLLSSQFLLSIPCILLLIISVLILPLGGIYGSYRNKNLFTLTRKVTISWLLVLVVFYSLTNLIYEEKFYSVKFISLWSFICLFLLCLNHVGLRVLLRKYRTSGGNSRNIVFWGSSSDVLCFSNHLVNNSWLGFRIIRWFSQENPDSSIDNSLLSIYGGNLSKMSNWLKSNSCDQIVFSDIKSNLIPEKDILQVFGDTFYPVSYFPTWTLNNMRLKIDQIGNHYYINIWNNQQTLLDQKIKRIFDFIISLFAIIFLSPLMLLICLMVKISSPGPILFTQDRYGLDGKKFKIYKFRTMYSSELNDNLSVKQATRNDPRITFIGKFLRMWSLDELAQLFNVIEGSMSLVGPRPHAVDHNEQYRRIIPGYMQRCSFKPGITGLAQIEGFRGETSSIEEMENRVNADLRYGNEWSLRLDLKILIKTLFSLVSDKAY